MTTATTAAECDWTILDDEGMEETLCHAARRVHSLPLYRDIVDREDLEQDARILLATKHIEMRQAVADYGLERVNHKLVQDLKDLYKTQAGRATKQTSLDVLLEQGQEMGGE